MSMTQACVQELRPQFRLTPGRDDLLIEWLDSIAPRQRSQAIRDALLNHLRHDSRREKGRKWEEDPALAAALDSLF